jgi:hypothetical protein
MAEKKPLLEKKQSWNQSSPPHINGANLFEMLHLRMKTARYSLIQCTGFKTFGSSSEWRINEQILISLSQLCH